MSVLPVEMVKSLPPASSVSLTVAVRLNTVALLRDKQTLAKNDPRRQPSQPPRYVSGNLPANWLPTSPNYDDSTDDYGMLFDELNLPSSVDASSEVKGFTLVHADTGKNIRSLSNGSVLSSSEMQSNNWVIRANTNGLTTGVKFELNGSVSSSNGVQFTHSVSHLANGCHTLSAQGTVNGGLDSNVASLSFLMGDVSAENSTECATTFNEPTSVNLIQNGSFEDGTSHWGGFGQKWFVTDAENQQGANAAKFTTAGGKVYLKQAVALDAHADYEISACLKSESESVGPFLVSVLGINIEGGNGWGSMFLSTNDDTWRCFSGTFNSGTKTSTEVRVWGNSTFVGTGYVDNVILKKVSAPVTGSRGLVTFKSAHNKYFVSEGNGGDSKTVNANRSGIGSWEKFTVILH